MIGPAVSSSDAGYSQGNSAPRSAQEFNLLGWKWLPGANTSDSIGLDPAPGGATWSIMGAGLGLDPAFGVSIGHEFNLTQVFDSLLPAVGAEVGFVNQALNTWAAVSGFTNLGQVADGGGAAGASNADGGHLGDIRIAAWELVVPGEIAHTYAPGTADDDGPGGNIYGDLHMDVGQMWVDDPSATESSSNVDYFTIMLHEMGHALGLGHSDVSGSVMYSFYEGARRSLQADDIAGIQAIYGTVPEPSTMVLLMGAVVSATGIRPKRVLSKLPANC